jgi:hypothetical protein
MRSLLLVLSLALLTVPATGHASCLGSSGDELVLVGTGPRGGVVLLVRRAAYGGSAPLTGATPTRLELRRDACSTACDVSAPLAALATNLYALRLPSGLPTGRWQVRTAAASVSFEVSAVSASGPAISARPRVGAQSHVSLGSVPDPVPEIVLADPAPAGALGLLARWQGSSFFMPVRAGDRTRFVLSPGRCRAPLPGFTRPTAGSAIELAFVDSEGRSSPTSAMTYTPR